MKPREYCCCAIPIINAGIYTALVEQLVAGIVVGVLSMATPHIVGAATPSFAAWVFGIACLAGGALQVIGLIAVSKESAIMFRRYLTLHTGALLAIFSLGAAWTAWSAVRHSTAKTNCENDFFDMSNSNETTEADDMCNIFPWVDVGIMGALWVLLGVFHLYLYIVVNSYSKGLVRDHAKYDALNDSSRAFNDTIPMSTRGDVWDTKPEADPAQGYAYRSNSRHANKNSATSMSDVISEPVRRATDEYSDYTQQNTYPPVAAHTLDDNATPKYSDSFYSGPSPHGQRPPASQAHPG